MIRAPLPAVWFAQATRDSFRAGPSSGWVLQIERKRGAGDHLPSVEQLRYDFIRDFPRGVASTQVEKTSGEVSILVFLLSGPVADGGSRSTAVMLGAKRIGQDLYLCSTVPGQTLADAQLAASACEGLWIEPS